MNTRKIGGLIIGLAILAVLGFTIYKILTDKEVGFNEIITFSILFAMFFSTITWGGEKEKDGILQKEELGKKITEQSSKISYLILVVLILIAVYVDHLISDTYNIFLLGILGVAMVLLPLVEFLVSRKYQ
ncbi:hypothetical protein AJ85_00945 [Alkalihalobacillus alcalophilus ATCC 27647 = CGMCC 1.3604]|uniref:DUF2178 domain-containing protein n=1 Tax=Alkalihalobacillus alcalophilus ATCC 27647 = CGMCC 1.3604 TaxID=1218173 RepID=A0A094WIS0_ALKAL|nr:hypothetical protein [Alkalihalobacillus alcalophilus]KGA96721.1 hypothetical protein BALCAV_0214590 [Alkalihalobacillus alcalophilus ATCC 27647 = CGMCC 1.3604]MED1561747.1 hypothetical protein [Alkalihalobacillus alcalophilus]THG91896.1 hypothetical protein AJ85_00945 [Alkalihalobacillus alcalophilus ATCC 27647 = CGMCC 1.3604]